jgi:hypothetical protein
MAPEVMVNSSRVCKAGPWGRHQDLESGCVLPQYLERILLFVFEPLNESPVHSGSTERKLFLNANLKNPGLEAL